MHELLSLKEEYELLEVIVSLHPHKAEIIPWLERKMDKTVIRRRGWGFFQNLVKEANNGE